MDSKGYLVYFDLQELLLRMRSKLSTVKRVGTLLCVDDGVIGGVSVGGERRPSAALAQGRRCS